MKRSRSIAWLALALGAAACLSILSCVQTDELISPDVTFVANADDAVFDSTCTLAVGAPLPIDGGAARITLVGISRDSRCPKGARCIYPGAVAGRIEALDRSGIYASSAFEVANGVPGPESEFPLVLSERTYTVRVIRVEPYPTIGVPIPRSTYVTTVRLVRTK